MKNEQAVPVGQIIEAFLEKGAAQRATTQVKILDNWKKIITKKASQCAQPVLVRNKVLVVIVSNSAWLHQLTLEKEKIIQKINKTLKQQAIDGIRFKLGNVRF
ncbi:MAG: DUF721 domain-containing protein [Candidatus Omnitrophica bacterium]|nr:DUF721 domain-containing protein [Candidatus Omnitrophota bacterium]MBU1925352.1 DUF721 domain-containing protein [Candidatus Omnitrophota bacterium]